MLTHQWPKISSDFACIYENITGGRGSARDPAGSSRRFPRTPSGTPTARACGGHPLRLGRSDCGAQINGRALTQHTGHDEGGATHRTADTCASSLIHAASTRHTEHVETRKHLR